MIYYDQGITQQYTQCPAPATAAPAGSPQFAVYRVFFSIGQNVRIADGQDLSAVDVPIELVRTVTAGQVGGQHSETFACPSCRRTYSLNVNGPSVDFRCIKCGTMMLIASRSW